MRDGINDPVAAHYEEEFEFPFWALVKQCAEEKDISYSDAAVIVCPEYSKTLRIRDVEWSDEQIRKADEEGFTEVKTYDGRVGQTESYQVGKAK
jgi:hypothetical protein